MVKYNIPKRKYNDGPKKVISLRLSGALIKEVDAMAKTLGWATTDLVSTVLDQFIQGEKKK